MAVTGLNEVLENLKRFNVEAESQLNQIVNATAINIHAHAVDNIQTGAKTGVVYGNHQASAPGESPATDTGALVGSLHFKQANKLTAHVYTKLTYAPYLEFGTSRMEARPFMHPALRANEKAFRDNLNNLVKLSSKGLK